MKCLLASFLFLFLIGCGGKQPETDPSINIPAEEVETVNAPDLTAGIDRANQEVCRTNMQMAASNILMFQAQNAVLPESMGEASSVPVQCPEGGEYIYTVENGSWKIECPANPSHGFIENGTASW
jgi:hypothetical protein